VAYTTQEAREQILDDLGYAIEEITLASDCLGLAYELVHGGSADRLEEDLFRPVQSALGKAKRTQSGFATRVGMAVPALEAVEAGVSSQGARALVDRAGAASAEASRAIAELQDSMLPIEAGDAELRAGLAEVRDLVDGMSARTREFVRVLGR
jgi:hypothetical protein